MTLAEQVAQLRQLIIMSHESRMLDLILVNILDELVEAIAALRDGDQPRGLGSI
jgi:hypothetical protein